MNRDPTGTGREPCVGGIDAQSRSAVRRFDGDGGNRLYRYYVSQDVLKHGPEAYPVGRVPAAEIEAAVIDQLRGTFRRRLSSARGARR